jgi:hypothetical protein
VKFSSVVSIQIFSLNNANPSINEIHVENDFFSLLSKFEMKWDMVRENDWFQLPLDLIAVL